MWQESTTPPATCPAAGAPASGQVQRPLLAAQQRRVMRFAAAAATCRRRGRGTDAWCMMGWVALVLLVGGVGAPYQSMEPQRSSIRRMSLSLWAGSLCEPSRSRWTFHSEEQSAQPTRFWGKFGP